MGNAEQSESEPAEPAGAAASASRAMVGLDKPDSVWNRAAAATPLGDPFCSSTAWQFSFHESFAPERALHVRSRGRSIVGVAERQHPHLGPLLEPLESHWLFGCPLLGPDAVDLLDDLLQECETPAGPPGVVISGLLPGATLARAVFGRFRPRFDVFALHSSTQVRASLAGGLDGYLSRRTGRWRRNLRQQNRRANDRGVYYERCLPRTTVEAATVYARVLAVERRSWKGIGHCGMAESPSREFYALMLRRLAHAGSSRVILARCGDDDIGFIFGGLAGSVYRGQQFSFADDWRAASIGNLLQLEQLRWLCEEGAECYDMGPEMAYKRHWTEIKIPIEAWLLQPRGRRA